MDGNALEVAIALWRSPALRAALRQQPLPEDVGEVIVLAAGASERLAQAAARAGERPQHLLEAVRFYLREVLLFDGADAYRVLGVSGHAEHARIKAHHSGLQHWLHPDRRGNDWESIYATRINAAWAELRSPERRARYDARQEHAGIALAPHRVLVSDWRASPAHQAHWAGWLAVGVTVAGCLWLAVLLDRKSDIPAPQWPVADSDRPGSPRGARPAATRRAGTSANQGDGARASNPAAGVIPPLHVAAPRPIGRSAAVSSTRSAIVTATAAPSALVATVAAPTARAPRVASPPARMSTASAPPAVAPSTEPVAPRLRAVAARAAPVIDKQMAPPQPELDPGRARLAHHVGREVTRYLVSDAGHVPPIWRTVAAQDAAAALRARLDDGAPRIIRIFRRPRLGEPVWRIAPERATMTTSLQPAVANADRLTLRVELAWRDGRWLVEAIGTEARP